MTRSIKGQGWLRTLAAGASTASYHFTLKSENGVLFAHGEIKAELTQMVEARAARRATLVLSGGRWMPIEVVDLAAGSLAFRSVGDVSFLRDKPS